MNVTEVATLAAALAAWVAIYWNRRLAHASEKDLASRLGSLEEVNRRIREERAARETQIGARVEAHDALEREALLTDMRGRGTGNDLWMLREIVFYQSFGMLYLWHRAELDSKEPALAQRFSQFVENVVHYVGKTNYTSMLSKRAADSSAILEAVTRETSAMEELVLAGQALVRDLIRLGVIDLPSFDADLKHAREVISDFDDILSRLRAKSARTTPTV